MATAIVDGSKRSFSISTFRCECGGSMWFSLGIAAKSCTARSKRCLHGGRKRVCTRKYTYSPKYERPNTEPAFCMIASQSYLCRKKLVESDPSLPCSLPLVWHDVSCPSYGIISLRVFPAGYRRGAPVLLLRVRVPGGGQYQGMEMETGVCRNLHPL